MKANCLHTILLILTFFTHESNAREVVGLVQINKDTCWNVGFIDYLSSAAACQIYCTFTTGCNAWSYAHGGVRRCHLCNNENSMWDVSCPTTNPPCKTRGLRIQGENAVSRLNDGIFAANKVCNGTLSYDNAFIIIEDLNVLINRHSRGGFESDTAFNENLPGAVAHAATVLKGESIECISNYTGPNHACKLGSLVFHQLRALILLFDGNADRAFPLETKVHKQRKRLFNKFGIFLADNGWMNRRTVKRLSTFYSQLPSFIRNDGILYDAPYATQTVRDAWKCNGQDLGYLGSTRRGFNVFQTQVGASYEQAFPNDTPDRPKSLDLQLTVTRHEVAHQFDRILPNRAAKGDARLKDMKLMLKEASKGKDDSWLRSQVGDNYFQTNPQEIIASHIGNQYLGTTSSQLRLAAYRLNKNSNWISPTYSTVTKGTATLTRSKKSCSSQTKGLGTFSTAQQCVDAAMQDDSCSYEIMYSTEYPSWGCRCCSSFEDMTCPTEEGLYDSHDLWDIYQFENASRQPTCEGNGLPLSWFLFNVDLMTRVNSSFTTFYENESKGKVATVQVSITRDSTSSRIQSLNIPFCGLITFGYNSTSGIVNSVSDNANNCTFSCSDDPNFVIKRANGREKSCAWVGKKPTDRCKKVGTDGRRAMHTCLKSCNKCIV